MNTLTISELIPSVIEARGALDFDTRKQGISPRRLPAWTRNQLPQPMNVMARMPSGVRLRFRTDSSTLSISFHATNLVTPPKERRPINITLEVDGQLITRSSTAGNVIVLNPEDPTDFELTRGDADTLKFDDLPAGDKNCELWLPHNAFIELRQITIDAGASLSTPDADTRKRWVHYGSSISHCMEATDPASIWPAVAARKGNWNLQNLGFGGQCHLDQFVARTIRDSDADLISIKTGINVINMDSMKERIFEPALHGFLDTIREGKPDHPVLLISAIYCPCAETNPGPTIPNAEGKFITIGGHDEVRKGCMTLSRTREILEAVTASRQDKNLHYIDGRTLFGESDAADLPDDLHPNPEGYIRMGERFADIASKEFG
jgi:hypothetical protein